MWGFMIHTYVRCCYSGFLRALLVGQSVHITTCFYHLVPQIVQRSGDGRGVYVALRRAYMPTQQCCTRTIFPGSVLRRTITLLGAVHPTEVNGVEHCAFSLPSYDHFLLIHTFFSPIRGIPSDYFEFGFVVRDLLDSIRATSAESPFVPVSVRLASECMLTFRSVPSPGMQSLVCGRLSYCHLGKIWWSLLRGGFGIFISSVVASHRPPGLSIQVHCRSSS